jgi:hypothetical protein
VKDERESERRNRGRKVNGLFFSLLIFSYHFLDMVVVVQDRAEQGESLRADLEQLTEVGTISERENAK